MNRPWRRASELPAAWSPPAADRIETRSESGGFLTEKRSRRGKVFFGCSNYSKTQCDFVTWDRPMPQPCPACQAKFVVKKENKRGAILRCLTCDWKSGASDDEETTTGPAAA